ncbi:MAG: DMT family transporter [Treponema sp.]|nr:DMT family transporter [Treponema sp.]
MSIDRATYKSDGLLLLTAAIWGLAFVAQRSGMASIGPFAFNAVRFALGAASLAPLILAGRLRARSGGPGRKSEPGAAGKAWRIAAAGTVLFCGASLQQVGIVTTTAGNAGFITSLYVVLVPIIGFVFRRSSRTVYGLGIWAGAVLALVGLYVLSVGSGLRVAPGDLLELAGALFWAVHILILGRFARTMDALELAAGQFAVCAALSLGGALLSEPALFGGLMPAALPILYGGLFSIGIAYTLQIVAQKSAHPAHASIILSMEALFAGIGGVVILAEPLTWRLAGGGLLMLSGMAVSQLWPVGARTSRAARRSGT